MGKDNPAEPDLKYLFSAPVLLLGQALAPIAAEFQLQLQRSANSTDLKFEGLRDVSHHLSLITQALVQLDQRLPDLMRSVFENETGTALDVGQAVGRMEQSLQRWTEGYMQLQASRPTPEAVELHRLLIGIYRHHIATISDWLNRLVQAINDPLAELEQQHLQPVNGRVVLPISLSMTEPTAEMARLNEIAHKVQQTEAPQQFSQPQQHPARLGFCAKVGAMVFGLGVANALW